MVNLKRKAKRCRETSNTCSPRDLENPGGGGTPNWNFTFVLKFLRHCLLFSYIWQHYYQTFTEEIFFTCSIPIAGLGISGLPPPMPPHIDEIWPEFRPWRPPPPIPTNPARPGMPPIMANGLFIPEPPDPFSNAETEKIIFYKSYYIIINLFLNIKLLIRQWIADVRSCSK